MIVVVVRDDPLHCTIIMYGYRQICICQIATCKITFLCHGL